jgi:hypothetical protein
VRASAAEAFTASPPSYKNRVRLDHHAVRAARDHASDRSWRAKQQSRKTLPKRIAAPEKANAELRQEAKGIK